MNPKSLFLLAAVFTLGACANHQSYTSKPQFIPGTGTIDLGGMPGSEGPVAPTVFGASARSAELDEENAPVTAVPTTPRADEVVVRDSAPERPVAKAKVKTRKHWNKNKNARRANRSTVTGASRAPRMGKDSLWRKEMALNQLHHINQKEIAMAKLAKDKSQDQQVIAMADRILADHQQLETKVKSVADGEDVSLHSYQLATHEAAFLDRLEGMEGSEFNRAFLAQSRDGHALALRDLRGIRARDPEVAALIRSAIPSIRAHERMTTTGASRVRY